MYKAVELGSVVMNKVVELGSVGMYGPVMMYKEVKLG